MNSHIFHSLKRFLVVQNYTKALKIKFISFDLSSLEKPVENSAEEKRTVEEKRLLMIPQQPFSRLIKSKEMNPIFKAFLNLQCY